MALNAAQRLEWHPPASARAEAGAGAGLADVGVVRAAFFFFSPARRSGSWRGTQFSCFTGTKVQILTQKAVDAQLEDVASPDLLRESSIAFGTF